MGRFGSKTLSTIALSSFSIASALPANATPRDNVSGFVSGSELARLCHAPQQSELLDFAAGVVDAGVTITSDAEVKPFCLPAGISRLTAASTACDWLGIHAEAVQSSAATIVIKAMRQSFPCPKP